eukprot:TRINITY_DN6557_c0_g1_i3.p1 TRINITY_DN6557_c0_g1~~TRINITY_DN6557_c0_g1_i3.p1  ORF type:complete len:182 (+),score=14.06 TRINITY_DN6557_c0_g1_i3:642-1187(+)
MRPEIKEATMSMRNTPFQPLVEMNPVKRGPKAAPTDPVPSMMAVTVANALELHFRELCVPRSAETAVVMRAYGPFTHIPATIISIMFIAIETPPYTLYKIIAGIAQYINVTVVMALASSLSEMCPARIPPTTPPKSNNVERFPDDLSDKYTPPIAATTTQALLQIRITSTSLTAGKHGKFK